MAARKWLLLEETYVQKNVFLDITICFSSMFYEITKCDVGLVVQEHSIVLVILEHVFGISIYIFQIINDFHVISTSAST